MPWRMIEILKASIVKFVGFARNFNNLIRIEFQIPGVSDQPRYGHPPSTATTDDHLVLKICIGVQHRMLLSCKERFIW